MEGGTVTAIWGQQPERVDELAARHAIPFKVNDPGELMGQVDAVLLATPNASHASIGVPLLESGVHVLVEKPMARTVAECDRLLAAAAAGGAVLAVGGPILKLLLIVGIPLALGIWLLRRMSGGRTPPPTPPTPPTPPAAPEPPPATA